MSRERGDSDLLDWRRRRLELRGFGPQLALALASDRRVDLHELLELTDRGCPPELAARILAPLDGPDDAPGGAGRRVDGAGLRPVGRR
jgi:hypothetical protein